MNKRWLMALLITALSLTGCDSGSSGSSDDPSSPDLASAIYSMDIAGAQGLAITGRAPDSDTSVATASVSTADDSESFEATSVYKILPDGRFERVPVEDEDGAELPRGTVTPVGVADISASFVAMQFWVPGFASDVEDGLFVREQDILTYLVHKESGRAYEATSIMPGFIDDPEAEGEEGNADDPPMPSVNLNLIDVHEIGDYLYISAPTEEGIADVHSTDRETLLTRVDISNLGDEPLQAEELPKGPEPVGKFEVHSSGDFLTYVSGTQDSGIRRLVNLTDSGPTSPTIPLIEGETWPNGDDVESNAWTVRDFDGNIYIATANPNCFCNPGASDPEPVIRLYEMQGLSGDGATFGSAIDMEVIHARTGEVEGSHGGLWRFLNLPGLIPVEGHPISRHEIGGRLLYIDTAVRLIEVDVGGQQVIDHTSLVVEPMAGGDTPEKRQNVSQIEVSENFVWLLGRTAGSSTDNIVVRHDPARRTIAQVEVDSNLEIAFFDVQSSDVAVFEAFDSNDAAWVRGEISIATGEARVTQTLREFDPRLFALNPVRPVDFISIDGNPQEWPTDVRVFTGGSGSGDLGDDLDHYSEQTGHGRYYGLVEFHEEDINRDNWTVVNISDVYRLEIHEDDARLVDTSSGSDESVPFDEAGARFAIGQAVEFFVPLSALDLTGSPTAVWIKRFADDDEEPDYDEKKDRLP